MEVDILQMLITGGSLQSRMLRSFVREKIGCATFSPNACSTHHVHQPYTTVSHYFTPSHPHHSINLGRFTIHFSSPGFCVYTHIAPCQKWPKALKDNAKGSQDKVWS